MRLYKKQNRGVFNLATPPTLMSGHSSGLKKRGSLSFFAPSGIRSVRINRNRRVASSTWRSFYAMINKLSCAVRAGGDETNVPLKRREWESRSASFLVLESP